MFIKQIVLLFFKLNSSLETVAAKQRLTIKHVDTADRAQTAAAPPPTAPN